MARHSTSTEGVVLKRVNVGETDRIVTLFTPSLGKVVCVAKGVRKMQSSQRAAVEPGNHVRIFLIETKSLPILSQTVLLNDFAPSKRSLSSVKKLLELLEVIDRLFPEGVEEPALFLQVLELLSLLAKPETSFLELRRRVEAVVTQLGYPPLSETHHQSLMEYVAEVANRPLHSYDFLTPNPVV